MIETKPFDVFTATLQETHNYIVRFMRKQGVAAIHYDRYQQLLCVYRGPNATMCAFGCLLPDAIYNPSMEQTTAALLIGDYASLAPLRPNSEYFDEMQSAHDTYMPRPADMIVVEDFDDDRPTTMAQFEACAKQIADHFGLTHPAL